MVQWACLPWYSGCRGGFKSDHREETHIPRINERKELWGNSDTLICPLLSFVSQGHEKNFFPPLIIRNTAQALIIWERESLFYSSRSFFVIPFAAMQIISLDSLIFNIALLSRIRARTWIHLDGFSGFGVWAVDGWMDGYLCMCRYLDLYCINVCMYIRKA